MAGCSRPATVTSCCSHGIASWVSVIQVKSPRETHPSSQLPPCLLAEHRGSRISIPSGVPGHSQEANPHVPRSAPEWQVHRVCGRLE